MKFNHNTTLLLSLLIFFFVEINAQIDALWVGENLNEIYFEDGKWIYQTENDFYEVHEIDSKYYKIPEFLGGKHKWEIGFEKLSTSLDTLYLKKGLTTKLFVKADKIEFRKFKFYAFEYDLLGSFRNVKTKYHLNQFGIFRKSNAKNETLIEEAVSTEVLESFYRLLKRIDLYNLKKAGGMSNNCDNQEYRFTFWDLSGNRYEYSSIWVRKQLKPIQNFITEIEKQYAQPSSKN